MNLTHVETGRTISIVVDNVVYRPDGCLLVESMYSGLVDLTSPSVDLVARIHPKKAESFEWILTGQCTVASAGKQIPVLPEVELHVNNPRGGIVVRQFSEFSESCRLLRNRGQSSDVRKSVTLAGFEPDAEPVIHEMRNGSLLLVFAFIPPGVAKGLPRTARQFDLNKFGAALERAAGVPLTWDDREVLVVPRPKGFFGITRARRRLETIERIRRFLQSYWGAES